MAEGKQGRRREGQDVKLAPLNMRTDPALRRLIEESADRMGRSLTQEVERRLRTSFILEDVVGGQHVHALVLMLGATINRIEVRTGKRWIEDEATWRAVQEAAKRLIVWDRPPAPLTEAVKDGPQQMRERTARAEQARTDLIEFRRARTPYSGMSTNNALAEHFLSSSFAIGESQEDWSEDDRKKEAQLLSECNQAEAERVAGVLEYQKLLDEWEDAVTEAKDIGMSEAESMFALIGPRSAA